MFWFDLIWFDLFTNNNLNIHVQEDKLLFSSSKQRFISCDELIIMENINFLFLVVDKGVYPYLWAGVRVNRELWNKDGYKEEKPSEKNCKIL